MERFKFSLERMLGYRGQLLDREKNNLRQLNAAKAQLEMRKDDLVRQQKDEGQKLAMQVAAGTTAMVISKANYMLQNIRRTIETIDGDIAQLETAIDKQRQVVVKASQDVTVLEKLKERQLEEYNLTAARIEQAQVIEFVTNGIAAQDRG